MLLDEFHFDYHQFEIYDVTEKRVKSKCNKYTLKFSFLLLKAQW
jgi:hypothetical protein